MGQEVFNAGIISYNNYNFIEQTSWSSILPVMIANEPGRGSVLEAPANSSPRINTSVMPILVSPGVVSVVGVVGVSSGGVFESNLIIPLYLAIFLLAVVGNSMVLITLAQNKRMRTVTNVYLLNLAVSDLLLGVFCMPFTLVGQVLRNFVFGDIMCKLIPYFQAVSVSVGVWTLVAISLERCFAICRPLKSRRWQTQCHAYKMIVVVWIGSLFWNLPILVVSRRQAMRHGKHKCREVWPSASGERAYNLFLDVVLLLIPLSIMILAYSLIVSKLWRGLRREIRHHSSCRRQQEQTGCSATPNNDAGSGGGGADHVTIALTPSRHSTHLSPATASNTCPGSSRRKPSSVKLWLIKGMVQVRLPNSSRTAAVNSRCSLVKSRSSLLNRPNALPETSRLIGRVTGTGPLLATSNPDLIAEANSAGENDQQEIPATHQYSFSRQAIRSNYMDKSIEAKKKVIRMLFVIIAEFFVCWAPLHVLNTWYLFSPEAVYHHVGSTGVSLVQLLAYVSSCCNPITYCFMNRKFRQAFLGVFHCYNGSSSQCWGCFELGGPGRSAARQRGCRDLGTAGGNINSDLSGNDSTIVVRRVTGMPRSEVLVLEGEDRV